MAASSGPRRTTDVSRSSLLNTKVAGRILGLFFIGAIVPVLILQILSYRAVSSLLVDQSEDRLGQLADATVQVILERLASTTTWVEAAGLLALRSESATGVVEDVLDEGSPGSGVVGLAVSNDPDVRSLGGRVGALPSLSDDERARLSAGGAVLRVAADTGGGHSLHLALPDPSGSRGVLWGTLQADSIWAAAMVLASGPDAADACVLDTELRPFVCLSGVDSDLALRVREARPEGLQGLLEFEASGEAHLAAWRRVYLRSGYGAPDWTVAVSEASSSVHAPASAFNYNLPLALSIGLGLVLLLAHFLVQRTMEPLNALLSGTERIARHDLSTRVPVETDDEFGALARSFNDMAEQLGAQFGQIEAAQAIDRAVIEDNSSSRAIQALIDGSHRLLSGGRFAIVLFEEVGDDRGGIYRVEGERLSRAGMSADDMARLEALSEGLETEIDTTRLPGALADAGWSEPLGPVILQRMRVQETEVGFAFVKPTPVRQTSAEDRVRRLVARAAVALNENRLRRELVEFGGETLRALANAIDAKSQWTTGHSERVTDLAWAIGRKLGLGPRDLDMLHRGGLLHDIGKIGVPTEILDFPGRLDEDQRAAVEAHPVIGARILEPIRVFKPLLDIVLHHHERWDGDGYPHGLSGLDIPRLARVVAVADVFDALVSPRPYRGPLPLESVMAHMVGERGAAFDPEVLDAFLSIMEGGWRHGVPGRGVAVHG